MLCRQVFKFLNDPADKLFINLGKVFAFKLCRIKSRFIYLKIFLVTYFVLYEAVSKDDSLYPDKFIKGILIRFQNLSGFMPNTDIVSLSDDEFQALMSRFGLLFSCGKMFDLLYVLSKFVSKMTAKQKLSGKI